MGRSTLEWAAVRPLPMSNRPLTGPDRAAADGLLPPGGGRVSLSDVAHFTLRQVEGEEFPDNALAFAC
jgi:hypothetical protein